MDSLAHHFAYLEAEYGAACAAPLSSRKALMVAVLIDAYGDRLFASGRGGDDILAFRAGLAAASPALNLIFSLCARRDNGPRLITEAVPVPLFEYSQLPVEDFMVSLYNAHAVQRVRIALPDGGRREIHEVLAEAIEDLRQVSPA